MSCLFSKGGTGRGVDPAGPPILDLDRLIILICQKHGTEKRHGRSRSEGGGYWALDPDTGAKIWEPWLDQAVSLGESNGVQAQPMERYTCY